MPHANLLKYFCIMSNVPSFCFYYCSALLLCGNYTLCHCVLMLFDLPGSDVIKKPCDAPKGPDDPLLTRPTKWMMGFLLWTRLVQGFLFSAYSFSLEDFLYML